MADPLPPAPAATKICPRCAETGRGMALAGIVLGWVGIGGMALVLLLLIGLAAPSHF